MKENESNVIIRALTVKLTDSDKFTVSFDEVKGKFASGNK